MNIRLSDDKAAKVLCNERPIECYNEDHDRIFYGEKPKYFSVGQIKKLDRYFCGNEYWDSIVAD